MKRRLNIYVHLIIVLLPMLLFGLLCPSITASFCAGAQAAQTAFSLLEDASGIQSDDFNTCALNEFWDFVNPLGDCTAATEGVFSGSARLALSVPAGTKHSISSSDTNAPRVMQPAADTDLEVEAKFQSALSEQYQIDGVLVEGTGLNEFLRFDFYSDGSDTHVYAASLADGVLHTRHHAIIADPPTHRTYMHVGRVGNEWTQSYSYDGYVYTETTSFLYTMTVSAVGVFAGNLASGSASPPAHTALVDYFLNVDSPFEDENGDRNELTVCVVGNGGVDVNPDKFSYSCYEAVDLTATADPDWTFAGWSGDLTGSNNPETVSMTGSRVITGTFTEDAYTLTINTVGSGSVGKDPDQATYHYGDVVTLTATADPGWTFTGWSGDLSGSANPETGLYLHRHQRRRQRRRLPGQQRLRQRRRRRQRHLRQRRRR
jgi:hypothetical protein